MRKSLTNGDYAEAVFLVDANGNAASSGPGGGGDASATNQLTQIDKLNNIDTDLGSAGDSAATSDTGSFSIISLIKRVLSTKLPNLVSNRIPVDGSGVTQPISGTVAFSNTSIQVSNFPSTQPISGTVAFSNTSIQVSNFPSTQAISASTLPLPTNAASQSDVQAIRDRLMPSSGISVYSAIGTSAGANIKNSAGTLYNITCTNLNGSIRYLQLFDSTSAPSGTPIRSYPVYGSGGFLVLGQDLLGGAGVSFTTGITFGFSTTALTYTAGSASDAIINVRYA
ncbi:hypothetical protein NIES2100_34950 [Calothrix sp. NIES-2100]|uniref:hypothetical protein n=1 Tax=Calothrix sp. NIES-2100 TaxID=1954172 RepID=UPI000B601951|nr:hypothetical protein NIES2100_34950 [Calothrix sp. NIES-2100]